MSPIEVMARSDAAFDGRPWMGMSRADRNRYLARSRAALESLAERKDTSIGMAAADWIFRENRYGENA